jgi:hypothetical protein
VKAVLNLPESSDALFLANLVDRPFLHHIVEFMVDQGVREILAVGPACDEAQSALGSGCQWDMIIEYRKALSLSDYETAPNSWSEKFLLASAASLPQFPLRRQSEGGTGALIYRPGGKHWTGWAIIEARDAALMPPLCDHAALLSYLTLRDYTKLSVDLEFRCGSAEELWKAHQDALSSNLSSIFHGGLEVTTGVWIGRNASVAATAQITAPVYIGENSRIGADAQVGPFAVIAKDCLIAPRTIVRHTVVAPATYAGDNLELDHVLVNKRHLSDIRFGVSVERVDSPILDSVFDFHWAAIPRRLGAAIVVTIRQVLFSGWSKLTNWRLSWRRAEILEPSAPDGAVLEQTSSLSSTGNSAIPSVSNSARLRSKSARVAAND